MLIFFQVLSKIIYYWLIIILIFFVINLQKPEYSTRICLKYLFAILDLAMLMFISDIFVSLLTNNYELIFVLFVLFVMTLFTRIKAY